MRYYTARTNESPKPKPPEPPDLKTLGPSPVPLTVLISIGLVWYAVEKSKT